MTTNNQEMRANNDSHLLSGPFDSSDFLDWELLSLQQEVPPSHSSAETSSTFTDCNRTNQLVCHIDINHTSNATSYKKIITKDQIDHYRQEFARDRPALVAQNAVSENSVWDVTLRRDLIQNAATTPYFSINLDQGGMPVTNQKGSGRCWLFGMLNLFRFGTRNKLNLDNFEFSEAYLYFWHLLEQCNHFLELVISTAADCSTDDRLLSQFLQEPIDDGGDWGIAVNLIQKYGIVPKSAYPESYSSSNTDDLIDVLTGLLQSSACRIRGIYKNNGHANNQEDDARVFKSKIMKDIWRILCIHLGTPPACFDWQWRDADGAFHRFGVITPSEFLSEFVTVPFDSYVSLIQDPRHEYYKRYFVQHSTVVCGGTDTYFLNIPAEEMKAMVEKMLQDGNPVWFACNVDTQCSYERGLWDAELYDTTELYGITGNPAMSKADRIRYGSPMGTHVMLFTGVDIGRESVPRRWRVENSWGDDEGSDGYFTMNDNWFDEYVFEIVVPPNYLSKDAAAGLHTTPISLPGWDPMCAAGRRSRKQCHRHF